jgi:hypothetical protein
MDWWITDWGLADCILSEKRRVEDVECRIESGELRVADCELQITAVRLKTHFKSPSKPNFS